MRSQAVIDLLQGSQVSPCLQLRDILDLRVRFQHHEIFLRNNEVYVHHLLTNLSSLLALLGHHELNLLLAGENTAVRVAEPDKHIVIEVQVETP